MKETVATLSKKLVALQQTKGNASVVQGTVWNYEQLIEVIRERNKHNEIIKVEIRNDLSSYPKHSFSYSIWYYNMYDAQPEPNKLRNEGM